MPITSSLEIGRVLAGVTVLELSSTVAGGYCGHLLAMMGARVVRLDLRMSADCPSDLLPRLQVSLHGAKQRLELDDDAGLVRVLSEADVVVADSRYDDDFDGSVTATTGRVLARAPSSCAVVDVTRIQTSQGDLAAATPLTVSAASAMSWGIGSPEKPPLALPYDLAYYLGGTEAAGAAALAVILRYLDHTSPQRWSVDATEVVASYVGQISSNFLPYERPWARDGARATMSGGSYPGAMFPCKDGNISIMCRTNREWVALLAAMGNPRWSSRPGFGDARVIARHHADEVDVFVRAWTSTMTTDEMTSLGKTFNFPVASILTVAEAITLNQFGGGSLFKTGSSVASQPWVVREPSDQTARDSARSTRPLRLAPLPGKPLNGLRVLDLSWVWSGPMSTAALADLGAEIIKVEHRKRTDPARLRGPAVVDGRVLEGPELELSPYFNQMNRGKKSVSIDISTDGGRELVLELVRSCDVVVENMRPGALERRGLHYEELSKHHPGIVMLSLSMMGQSGPLRGVAGYAPVMSGLSGLDSIVGYDESNVIGLYNPALGDPNGAAHGLALLMGALYRRARTGRGSWLDIAQVNCLLSTLRVPVILAEQGLPPVVPANKHATFAPHGTYPTAGDDEWVSVAVRTDKERSELDVLLMGSPIATARDREAALTDWIANRTAEEAVVTLRGARIPVSRVEHMEDVLSSEWARRTGLFCMLHHPHLGAQPAFTVPWRQEGRAFATPRASPLLAADTARVLGDILGMDEEALQALHVSGAIEMRPLLTAAP